MNAEPGPKNNHLKLWVGIGIAVLVATSLAAATNDEFGIDRVLGAVAGIAIAAAISLAFGRWFRR